MHAAPPRIGNEEGVANDRERFDRAELARPLPVPPHAADFGPRDVDAVQDAVRRIADHCGGAAERESRIVRGHEGGVIADEDGHAAVEDYGEPAIDVAEPLGLSHRDRRRVEHSIAQWRVVPGRAAAEGEHGTEGDGAVAPPAPGERLRDDPGATRPRESRIFCGRARSPAARFPPWPAAPAPVDSHA